MQMQINYVAEGHRITLRIESMPVGFLLLFPWLSLGRLGSLKVRVTVAEDVTHIILVGFSENEKLTAIW